MRCGHYYLDIKMSPLRGAAVKIYGSTGPTARDVLTVMVLLTALLVFGCRQGFLHSETGGNYRTGAFPVVGVTWVT
ncbi:hypothetical protein BaRGS_00035606 [Batillaria attramentaria]|uniref:Uncharacterized protein n=1 Tax=Batillaria attramentaria TaxID=370345 RepID=A0ABD0JDZ6_9CAEN